MGPNQQTGRSSSKFLIVAFIAMFALIGGYRLLNNSSADSSGQGITTAASIGLDVKIADVKQYQIDSSTQQQRTSIVLNIANNSSNVLQISPGLQMQLVDSTGDSHAMTAKYLSPGRILGGPLEGGKNWTGTIDFDMPAGQTPAKLIYQADGTTKPLELGL